MANNKVGKTDSSIIELENDFFESHVAYSIVALANLITQNTIKNTLAGTSLSVYEWRIMRLAFIYGKICAADVINIFGLDKTTTSRSVSKLKNRKLVKLSPDPDDKRQTNITLTAAGKRLHTKIIQRDQVSDESIEKVFSRQELKSIHSAMRKLRPHVKSMLSDKG